MTTEQKEKILKKVKKSAGIPETVTVYDERIDDLVQDAIIEMRTGGVSQDVMDEASPAVIEVISIYVKSGLRADAGDTANAKWAQKRFEDRVFKLSLTPDGTTLEGFL